MPKSTHVRYSNHDTNVSSHAWTPQRIAVCALFTAVAIIVSFIEIPLFPAAPYLKYDPSGIICLMAGFAFGPIEAACVSVLMWLPHFFANPLGALMGIVSVAGLSIPASLIYQKRKTHTTALLALLVGSLVSLVLCLGANLIVTPLYTPLPISAVLALMIPVLIPFNVLKLALNSVIALTIYKRVIALTKRS